MRGGKFLLLALAGVFLSACGSARVINSGKIKDEKRSDVRRGMTGVQLKPPRFGNKAAFREIVESRLDTRKENRSRILSRFKKTISARNTPLRTALFALFKGTPFSLSFGAGFENKPVMAEFKDIPMNEALDQLLSPLKLDYEISGNTVTVGIPRLETRVLRFDYPIADRTGSRSFSVTGFTGGSGGGGGGSGSASITSSNQVDIWREIGEALTTIIFGGNISGVDASGRVNLSDESGKKLITSPVSGAIFITATSIAIEEAERFLRTVEVSIKRQVLIEVVLLQVTLNDQFLFGLNLDYQLNSGSSLQGIIPPFVAPPNLVSPTAISALTHSAAAQRFSPDSGGFRLGVTGANFSALLDTISQAGQVDILASPKISTLNNQQAVISVVTDEVFFSFEPSQITIPQTGAPVVVEGGFTPERFTVGIVLDVLAQISNDNQVTLQIHPNISSIVRTATSPNGDTQPIIDRKELDTIITVQSGETIVIGGLIDEKTVEDERGIPFLKDIPYLGVLFKRIEERVQKQELMLFITPKILEGEAITRITEQERARFKKPFGKKKKAREDAAE